MTVSPAFLESLQAPPFSVAGPLGPEAGCSLQVGGMLSLTEALSFLQALQDFLTGASGSQQMPVGCDSQVALGVVKDFLGPE